MLEHLDLRSVTDRDGAIAFGRALAELHRRNGRTTAGAATTSSAPRRR
ncbi:MAG: hypothetical protein M5R42_13415 [Rhodocyclaceae bacterium]|nr:hypothetical protein [Rhodocyclaceae bacterium]